MPRHDKRRECNPIQAGKQFAVCPSTHPMFQLPPLWVNSDIALTRSPPPSSLLRHRSRTLKKWRRPLPLINVPFEASISFSLDFEFIDPPPLTSQDRIFFPLSTQNPL